MTFFAKMFSAFTAPPKPYGPAGHRAYAVGDVHGRLDLLEVMLAKIESDIVRRPPSRNHVVFLGDLIDRGPDSAAVIERLRTWEPRGAEPHFLCGNHEEIFLRMLAGEPSILTDWLRFGGSECLASYGLPPSMIEGKDGPAALAAINAVIPVEHRDFVATFADTFRFGDYLFVHAGIRPGIDVSAQTKQDMRWIREAFLESSADHGFVVVHGHTISTTVQVRPNRIGVDTGAYRTGCLTAVAIEGDERWFLDTGDFN